MKNFLYALFLVIIAINSFAQDSLKTSKKEIDPTKPTNLYTQVNMNLEYQDSKAADLYGTRINIQYAPNPDNLILAELPLLYSNESNNFGIGDMRIRYFNAIKRNITKKFIAIAPFADISLPTGSFKNGLGTSSWSLSGGVILGFVLSKKFSVFPGINYIHITKPNTDLIQEVSKFSSNGIGLQFNASYIINKKTFIFINPIPTFLSTNGKWRAYWAAETNLNRIVIPNKFKMNIGWSPNFTNDVNIFRLGGTIFF